MDCRAQKLSGGSRNGPNALVEKRISALLLAAALASRGEGTDAIDQAIFEGTGSR